MILIARGIVLSVMACPEAMETLDEALTHVDPRKQVSGKAKMLALCAQLADSGNLRMPEAFNKEARLPDGSNFFAVKTNKSFRLRAYGWYSSRHKATFIISHFAFKKGEKLDDRDTSRVTASWRRVENE